MFTELLPDRERVLGPDHPDTLATRNNIASCAGEVGDAQGGIAAVYWLLRTRSGCWAATSRHAQGSR